MQHFYRKKPDKFSQLKSLKKKLIWQSGKFSIMAFAIDTLNI